VTWLVSNSNFIKIMSSTVRSFWAMAWISNNFISIMVKVINPAVDLSLMAAGAGLLEQQS
jgi:hypothetical protein